MKGTTYILNQKENWGGLDPATLINTGAATEEEQNPVAFPSLIQRALVWWEPIIWGVHAILAKFTLPLWASIKFILIVLDQVIIVHSVNRFYF